jgi:hypothetical protein
MTIKNIAILGTCLIFMVLFWSIAQLFYSFNLIEEFKSPEISSKRGSMDAISDFKEGYAYFKSIDGIYPLVEESLLETVYNKYAPINRWYCGTGSNTFKQIALDLKDYGYNKYYAISYNAELISLIHQNEINKNY